MNEKNLQGECVLFKMLLVHNSHNGKWSQNLRCRQFGNFDCQRSRGHYMCCNLRWNMVESCILSRHCYIFAVLSYSGN